MFDRISYDGNVLLFHTAADASQSGASTTLKNGRIVLDRESVSIGQHGPFPLPRDLKEKTEFRELFSNAPLIAVAGASKTPRTRPDWNIRNYSYRLYSHHEGIPSSGDVDEQLKSFLNAKHSLWNLLCDRCERAVDNGQTITSETLDELREHVWKELTEFNDSLGRSKDKLRFPDDDPVAQRAARVGAYWRLAGRLRHCREDSRPAPEGLEDHVISVLKQYPYDWSPFKTFEKNVRSIGKQIAAEENISDAVAGPVIASFERVFKNRRARKLKGFAGLPHRKEGKDFNWFHEAAFTSRDVTITKLLRNGVSCFSIGGPVAPPASGHPLMEGRKARLRQMRPITFQIEGEQVTFGILLHRLPDSDTLLKQWRLLCRKGKYWLNLIGEVPPAAITPDADGVAGLDFNWRRLRDGSLLIGMLSDGKDDLMIQVDPKKSPTATDRGGMISYRAANDSRIVTMALGSSRWGRNNLQKNANYGVSDTLDGAQQIRQMRDEAKDNLKRSISVLMGNDTPPHLSRCGARGLKEIAATVQKSHLAVAQEIAAWAVKDADYLRVLRKISTLLDGRLKKGYEQLAVFLFKRLSERGIRTIAIEEKFLKRVAEAEKKYQPAALQKSARSRQALGIGQFAQILEHIGSKHGISLVRKKAAHTSSRCGHCGETILFDGKRVAECPGCKKLIDQDQNAAHNLRDAQLHDTAHTPEKVVVPTVEASWTLTIGRCSPSGEVRQTRDLLLIRPREKEAAKVTQ